MGGDSSTPAEFPPDRIKHQIRFAKDRLVSKSQNHKTLRSQPVIAGRIRRFAQDVDAAVGFYNQFVGGTAKVHDIGTDRRLSAKPGAIDLAIPDQSPQSLLRLRGGPTKAAGGGVSAIMMDGHARSLVRIGGANPPHPSRSASHLPPQEGKADAGLVFV